jgi:hypothetical protein
VIAVVLGHPGVKAGLREGAKEASAARADPVAVPVPKGDARKALARTGRRVEDVRPKAAGSTNLKGASRLPLWWRSTPL